MGGPNRLELWPGPTFGIISTPPAPKDEENVRDEESILRLANSDCFGITWAAAYRWWLEPEDWFSRRQQLIDACDKYGQFPEGRRHGAKLDEYWVDVMAEKSLKHVAGSSVLDTSGSEDFWPRWDMVIKIWRSVR